MSLAELADRLPGYAADLRRNLFLVLGERGSPGLERRQAALLALAAAIAARHAPLTRALAAEAAAVATPAALDGARAAAALMAMSNIYHRFVHQAGAERYGTLRSGLRMAGKAGPSGRRVDFELACLAVSAVNGCQACVAAHERTLRERHGLPPEAVLSAARIASVVHAVAVTLEQAEAAG